MIKMESFVKAMCINVVVLILDFIKAIKVVTCKVYSQSLITIEQIDKLISKGE